MGNTNNLKKGKDTQFQSGIEQSETARKGGIASGIARREKKRARDIAQDVLSMQLQPDDMPEGFDIDNADVSTGIVAALARRALDGNVKAAETLLTLSGDYTKSVSMHASIVDDESAKEIDQYFARKDNCDEETVY